MWPTWPPEQLQRRTCRTFATRPLRRCLFLPFLCPIHSFFVALSLHLDPPLAFGLAPAPCSSSFFAIPLAAPPPSFCSRTVWIERGEAAGSYANATSSNSWKKPLAKNAWGTRKGMSGVGARGARCRNLVITRCTLSLHGFCIQFIADFGSETSRSRCAEPPPLTNVRGSLMKPLHDGD